jgi:hypothetical protein
VERSRARAAVVGDAGMLHARQGKPLFVSPPQQHRFNCPYQARTFASHPMGYVLMHLPLSAIRILSLTTRASTYQHLPLFASSIP